MEQKTNKKRLVFKYGFAVGYGATLAFILYVLSLIFRVIILQTMPEGSFLWLVSQILTLIGQALMTYLWIKETVWDAEKEVYNYLSQLKKDIKRSGFWRIQAMTLLMVVMAISRFILLVSLCIGGIYVVNELTGDSTFGQLLLLIVTLFQGLLLMGYFSMRKKSKWRQSASQLMRLFVAWSLYSVIEAVWLSTQEVEAVLSLSLFVFLAVGLLSVGITKVKTAFGWRLLARLSPKKVELIYGEAIGHLMRNHEQYFPIEPTYQSLANITHMEYQRGADRVEGTSSSGTISMMDVDRMTFIQTDIRCRYSLLKVSVFIPIHHCYVIKRDVEPPSDFEEKVELVMNRLLWWKKPIKRVFLSDKMIGCVPPLTTVTEKKGDV